MADKKTVDPKDTETTDPTETDLKETEKAETVEKTKYKLLKNIKYGNDVYTVGDKIEIAEEDLEEFKSKGIIEIEIE